MTRTSRLTIVLLAFVLAACGGPGPTGSADDGSSTDTLFVKTTDDITSLSAATGSVETTFPRGVASPDFGTLAATEFDGESSLVRRLDSRGDTLTRAVIGGDLAPRVVSGSGLMIALTDRRAGTDLYEPHATASTKIVVLDSSGEYREYVLEGNFEPEAFSVNDQELFMIEYLPALNPDSYQVRRLLLDDGRVRPIGRLKQRAPEQMNGTGRTQTYAPNSQELYTLYTQQAEAGHAHSEPGLHAFIHLLNLGEGWAHCIDLPAVFGSGDATASALAISPDGQNLYAVDWTHGAVALVRPDKLKVVDLAEVSFGSPDDRTFAVASGDRVFVAGNSAVVVLDAASLEVVDRWGFDSEVKSLALSSDAERLYVSVAGEVTTVDASTGANLGTMPMGGESTVVHVA